MRLCWVGERKMVPVSAREGNDGTVELRRVLYSGVFGESAPRGQYTTAFIVMIQRPGSTRQSQIH